MIRSHRHALAIFAALTLAIAAPAVASDDAAEDSPKEASPHEEVSISFWFDDEVGLLLYGTTDPETGEPANCDPEGEAPVVEEDGAVSGDLPPGCMALVIEGGEDGPNHGDVMSQTVAALKEIRSELDGPFGQYVREIAHSDFGKKDKDGTEESDEDADEGELPDETSAESENNSDKDKDGEHGPPDHAKGQKDEGDDSGADDEKGPPAHAKAHGRNK